MFCPNCGARQPEEDAKYCLSCGALLRKPQNQGMPAGQKTPVGRIRATTTSHKAGEVKSRKARPAWLIPAVAGFCVLVLAGVVLSLVLLRGGEGTNSTAVPTPTPPVARQDDSWTALVYLCGSNLETDNGYATDNLLELCDMGSQEGANIVIETGGSREWLNDMVDSEYLERFVLEGSELSLVDREPRASMGSEDTLADFISWGGANYPAEHYLLLFWDHGGGSLTGVCLDEFEDDGLALPEMDRALAAGGLHFDVVAFDTCLMATLETAQMLAPHADYLVASEEIIPGQGMAYSEWPTWFASTADPNDVEGLCEALVDTYMEKCADKGVASAACLSTVDLSKIDAVADAFGKAADAMARSTESAGTLQHLVVEGANAKAFGHADYLAGYTNMVDLCDLVECMSDQMEDEYEGVARAIRDAVVSERHGSACEGATGLSVYYPLAVDKDAYEAYRDLSSTLGLGNDSYVQYLAVRTGTYDPAQWQDAGIRDLDPVSASDAKGAFQYAGSIAGNGAFTVTITGNTEFVKVATYQFGQVQPDGTVVPLGSGNMLGLDIAQNGQVTYTDEFQGGVLNIGGAYAFTEIVDMVYGEDGPLYNLYSVPIELTTQNTAGMPLTFETNLLVEYDYAANTYQVLCYYTSASESGMASKSSLLPRQGDQIKFLVTRDKDGKVQTGNMGTITWSDGVEVQELFPGDASYVYQIVITDIFGNTYDPVSALITFHDGQRTAQLL